MPHITGSPRMCLKFCGRDQIWRGHTTPIWQSLPFCPYKFNDCQTVSPVCTSNGYTFMKMQFTIRCLTRHFCKPIFRDLQMWESRNLPLGELLHGSIEFLQEANMWIVVQVDSSFLLRQAINNSKGRNQNPYAECKCKPKIQGETCLTWRINYPTNLLHSSDASAICKSKSKSKDTAHNLERQAPSFQTWRIPSSDNL